MRKLQRDHRAYGGAPSEPEAFEIEITAHTARSIQMHVILSMPRDRSRARSQIIEKHEDQQQWSSGYTSGPAKREPQTRARARKGASADKKRMWDGKSGRYEARSAICKLRMFGVARLSAATPLLSAEKSPIGCHVFSIAMLSKGFCMEHVPPKYNSNRVSEHTAIPVAGYLQRRDSSQKQEGLVASHLCARPLTTMASWRPAERVPGLEVACSTVCSCKHIQEAKGGQAVVLHEILVALARAGVRARIARSVTAPESRVMKGMSSSCAFCP